MHLLVECPPKVPVSAFVNSLKGVTARRLRAQFTGRVTGTSCTGISDPLATLPHRAAVPPPSIIRQYIEQQRRPG